MVSDSNFKQIQTTEYRGYRIETYNLQSYAFESSSRNRNPVLGAISETGKSNSVEIIKQMIDGRIEQRKKWQI